VFESLTPVLLIISVSCLGWALVRLRKIDGPSRGKLVIAACLLILAVLFFFDAGEEISWGQRIIGWKTPALFRGNTQLETNIHNYYNAGFSSLHRSLVILPFFVLLSAWLGSRRRWRYFAGLVLPHPSTIGLACLIGFVALVWYQQQELVEEMLAVFALFYSLRVLGCLRAIRSFADT
jgi:hypothetical protein